MTAVGHRALPYDDHTVNAGRATIRNRVGFVVPHCCGHSCESGPCSSTEQVWGCEDLHSVLACGF